MISIMSNSSINKNDSIQIKEEKPSSTTPTNESAITANNRIYINSNSCLNSLESAQLKKLKKSIFPVNQQEYPPHLPLFSPSTPQQPQLLIAPKPERISPASISPSSSLSASPHLAQNGGYVKPEFDSRSGSTSPSLSSTNSNSNSSTNFGDQRTMDAADTLVSLAHSASSTPTVESKSFDIGSSNSQTPFDLSNGVNLTSDTSNNNIEIVCEF